MEDDKNRRKLHADGENRMLKTMTIAQHFHLTIFIKDKNTIYHTVFAKNNVKKTVWKETSGIFLKI